MKPGKQTVCGWVTSARSCKSRWLGLTAAAVALLSVIGPGVSGVHGAVLTFFPDRDTRIRTFSTENQNFGADPELVVGIQSIQRAMKSLVGFDVSSFSGQYTAIDGITLRLFFKSATLSTTLHQEVYEISAANGDWPEGIGTSASPASDGATFNNKDQSPVTPWAGSAGLETAGTDYVSTLLSSLAFHSSTVPADGAAVDFAFTGSSAQLTALMDNWVVSMPGLLLQMPVESGGGETITWYSRENGNSALIPQLIVEFTEPPAVPEPAVALLLVCGGLFAWRRARR